MQKKKRTFWQEQLAQMCSQIVSFFPFLCFFQFCIFAENTIKIGVSKKKKNKILKLKTVFFVVFFACLFFFKNPLRAAGRMRSSKTKKQKKNTQKNGPIFNFKRGKNWTSF